MNALRDWWRWHRWLPGFAIAWCLCDCAYCARKRRRARHRRDLLNLWELIVGCWRGRDRDPLTVEWVPGPVYDDGPLPRHGQPDDPHRRHHG